MRRASMARPTKKKKTTTRKKTGPKRAKRPAATRKKKTSRAPKAAVRPAVANEKALELARAVAAAVLDKKANDVVILDVRGRASYADYIVVASGESDVQLRAMADGVHEKL